MSQVKNNFLISWSGSATSAAVDIYSNGAPMALVIPNSFGATSITLTASKSLGGAYYPVVDETNTAITITVDGTTGKWYDLTNIFPASVKFVKFVASTSITKEATLVARDVT